MIDEAVQIFGGRGVTAGVNGRASSTARSARCASTRARARSRSSSSRGELLKARTRPGRLDPTGTQDAIAMAHRRMSTPSPRQPAAARSSGRTSLFDAAGAALSRRGSTAHASCSTAGSRRAAATRPASSRPAETLDLRELAERVNRIANVLVGELGLVPGNRVLLRAANNADDGRGLARGAEGRRRRGRDHAAAARARAGLHARQGADRARALRRTGSPTSCETARAAGAGPRRASSTAAATGRTRSKR